MGRKTTVKFINIYWENSKKLTISERFIKNIEKKYGIAYSWIFDDNVVNLKTDGDELYGDPETHIKTLLKTSKKYKNHIPCLR